LAGGGEAGGAGLRGPHEPQLHAQLFAHTFAYVQPQPPDLRKRGETHRHYFAPGAPLHCRLRLRNAPSWIIQRGGAHAPTQRKLRHSTPQVLNFSDFEVEKKLPLTK